MQTKADIQPAICMHSLPSSDLETYAEGLKRTRKIVNRDTQRRGHFQHFPNKKMDDQTSVRFPSLSASLSLIQFWLPSTFPTLQIKQSPS